MQNTALPIDASEAYSRRLIARYEKISEAISVLVFITGLAVLGGWIFDITPLKSVLPGMVTMKVNAAIGFMLLSLSLWLSQTKRKANPSMQWVARACSSIAILIGSLTLAEYVFGWNLGIDQFLIRENADAVNTPHAGRPSPLLALNLVFFGTAILLMDAGKWKISHPAHLLLFPAGLISALTFFGHIYGIHYFLYSLPGVTAIAVHSAAAFLMLCVGVLFARPTHGITSIFISETGGGVLARRMLLQSILALITLDYVIHTGHQMGWYNEAYETVIHNTLLIAFFAYTILSTSRRLEQTDITRMGAEKVLAASEREFRLLAEAVPQIVWATRADGWNVYYNQQWVDYTGLTLEESYGHGWNKPFHPDDQRRAWDAWQNAVNNKDAYSVECRLRRADGVYRWWLIRGVPVMDGGGKVLKWFGTCTDIDEIKRAERELLAAKENAEEATRLKDKFVSLVAHDLKSPLGSMVGFLKLVEDENVEPLNEGAKLVLRNAIESGRQMSRFIDDVLNISRLRTGHLKLDITFFDAKYLGEKMVADYAYLAAQKQIGIRNAIPANSRLYGDRILLSEALQNLITNAIKFCRKGDSVTISLAADDKTTICVTDTGPGIAKELWDNLFLYEKKTSTTGTQGETGSGLGLPLAMDILKLHGGTLRMQSEAGKGAAFSLQLPYVRPIVLIVDDDPSFRFLQEMNLRKTEAEIIHAADGMEALAMAEKKRPHLVITDIKMPNMDGLELLKKLKDKTETKDIPVMVVSGEYGMEIRDTVFKLGGADFSTKTIDINDFIPRVRRFIG